MALEMAINAAMQTPSGTREFYAACSICNLRGLEPLAFPVMPGPPMQNWQRVIAETLMQQVLRDAMMSPA